MNYADAEKKLLHIDLYNKMGSMHNNTERGASACINFYGALHWIRMHIFIKSVCVPFSKCQTE